MQPALQSGVGHDANSTEETAQVYSKSPFYDPEGPHAQWLAAELCLRTRLGPLSRILDVGCGTGTFALLLMKQSGASAVHGIEPDAARAAEAVERGVMVTVGVVDDETMSSHESGPGFDVIVLKEMVHLLPDAPACYSMLARILAPGGVIVTINRPHDPDFPLFELARENWASGPHLDAIKAYSEAAGLLVETHEIASDITIPKDSWKAMVANKVWSIYIDLTPEQLQEGLEEIDTIFGDRQEMVVPDRFAMFCAAPVGP